jgi:hypothetical protein
MFLVLYILAAFSLGVVAQSNLPPGLPAGCYCTGVC